MLDEFSMILKDSIQINCLTLVNFILKKNVHEQKGARKMMCGWVSVGFAVQFAGGRVVGGSMTQMLYSYSYGI